MKYGYKRLIIFTSLAALLVLPYLLMVQGIDFTDKGYILSLCQQLFLFPEVYQKTAPLWLSGALGHAWLFISPIKGMEGLNILFVLLLQLHALLFYFILKKYYRGYVLAPAICIVSLLSIPLFQVGYGYQSLTVFLLDAGALLFFEGIISGRSKYIFISAFLFSVSVLARLPNVLSFAFIVLLVGNYLYNKDRVNIGKQMMLFVAGIIAGFAFLAALIFACGYSGYFIPGMHEFFMQASGYGNAYTLKDFMGFYTKDSIAIILLSTKYIIVISIISYTVSFIQNAFKGNFISDRLHWLMAVLAVALGVWVVSFYNSNYILKYHFKYILPGVILAAGAFMLFVNRPMRGRFLLLLSGAMIYALSFAGSNTGMNPYGLFFLLLFACAEMLSFLLDATEVNGFVTTFARAASLFLICILAVLAFTFNYKFVYRDSNNRSQLCYTVNSPLLAGLYTTKPRADAVNELLGKLSTKTHPGDTIWANPNLPILYALTGTKPYTNHIWESLLLPSTLEKLIANREAATTKLPLIVRVKGTTRSNNWPERIVVDDDKYSVKREEVMNSFLSRHHYAVTWQNNFFEIWQAR